MSECVQWLSIIGSIASVAGIIATVWQFFFIASKTSAVKLAVEDTKRELSEMTSFSDINEFGRYVDEVEAYLRSRSVVEARISYKDLKGRLIVFLGYVENNKGDETLYKNLKEKMMNVAMDVKTLNGNASRIDWDMMLENLEEVKDCLNRISGVMRGKKI